MPEVFYKCWAASYEEDAKAANLYETYRPCDQINLAGNLFRKKIEFFKNGKCKWLQMAPNEEHFFIDAVWVYKRGKIIVRDNAKAILFKFEIEHLVFNRMKIMVKN